jgi:hypothetical protein
VMMVDKFEPQGALYAGSDRDCPLPAFIHSGSFASGEGPGG